MEIENDKIEIFLSYQAIDQGWINYGNSIVNSCLKLIVTLNFGLELLSKRPDGNKYCMASCKEQNSIKNTNNVRKCKV